MAARTATRNGTPPKFGVPTGHFLEISQKTNRSGPYQITDEIAVPPSTKKRREQLRDAERRLMVAQSQLRVAYALSGAPVPPMPEPPTEVQSAPPADADKDVKAAFEAEAAAVNERARLDYKAEIAQWKREIENWRVNLSATQQQIDDLTRQVKQAELDYEKATLGPQYDEIVAFFDDLDDTLWDEFLISLAKHWVPSQPDDGTCPTCGHLDDEDEAGKERKSSTG